MLAFAMISTAGQVSYKSLNAPEQRSAWLQQRAAAAVQLQSLLRPFSFSAPVQCREKFNVDAQLAKLRALKQSHPDNITAQVFDEQWFRQLSSDQQQRFLNCVNSGVENPTSEMGCQACNPNDYEEFRAFFKAVLERQHKVDLSKTKHINNWDLGKLAGLPQGNVLDLANLGLPALSMRVRTGRNLRKQPLPGSMTHRDRVQLEQDMERVFEKLKADPAFGGQQYSLTPGSRQHISDEKQQQLVKAHLMFKDMSADKFLMDAGIAQDWPHGRGCYVSEDRGFIIWVGEEDHLRIMAMQKGTVLNKVFDRLKAAIDVVEELIPGGCAYSPDFGVVTSCPTNIGTGMRASVHIQLPNLTADGTEAKVKKLCKPFGLSVRGVGGEHTPIGEDGTVDISPSARFCISEAEILAALQKGIEKVWKEEQKCWLQRSVQQNEAELRMKKAMLTKLAKE